MGWDYCFIVGDINYQSMEDKEFNEFEIRFFQWFWERFSFHNQSWNLSQLMEIVNRCENGSGFGLYKQEHLRNPDI